MMVRDLGLLAYGDALTVQEQVLEQVAAGGPEALLLVEHPPVVTLGRHGGEADMLVAAAELQRLGVHLVKATRGGRATCHFPGQLVGYLIVRLARSRRGGAGGLRGLVTSVEEAIIAALSGFGLAAQREDARPGVWIEGRKVAAIGFGVRRFVTYHGFSLNVGKDISTFRLIDPCGLGGVRPTSVSLELGRDVPMQEVKDVVVRQMLARLAPAAVA